MAELHILPRVYRESSILVILSVLIALAGCGGVPSRSSSSGGSSTSSDPSTASPTVTLSAQPVSITAGTSVTLSWTATNATSVTIDNGIGTVGMTGTRQVTPSVTTTYTATANSGSASAKSSTTITVTASSTPPPPTPTPTIQLSANPTSIVAGASSTLTWTSTNATSVTIDNGIGSVALNDSKTVRPSVSTTYTATASNGGAPVVSSVTITVSNPPPPSGVSVPTWHGDNARSGLNAKETILTPENVNSGSFGKVATASVDGQVYPQPLIVANVTINGGTHNVLYVATEHDNVYAFDADTGAALWNKSLLGPGMTPAPSSDTEGVSPEIGVLSTPVIDLSSGTLYLVAMVKNNGSNQFWLHALDIATSNEKFGAPKQIQATVSGTGYGNLNGKLSIEGGCYQRTGLALANGNIYVGFGHCSHGWVVAYDATTLAQAGVFNSSPNGKGAAIWMGGGAPAVDSSGNLFVETGVDADSTVTSGFSNAFLKLSSDLAFQDYFVPSNNDYLTPNDADLGSGAPIILPDNASSHPHEVIGAGKDGRIFIVDRDQMGGFSSTSNNVVQIVQSGVQQFDNFFSAPAYWNGNIYYHAENDVLRQFHWSNGLLSSGPAAIGTTVFGVHGATPSVSANGQSDAIVWELQVDGQPTNPAVLHAYNANNVATELYNSNQNSARDHAGPAVKFTVPTIANGKVYVPAGNEVDIYGLLP